MRPTTLVTTGLVTLVAALTGAAYAAPDAASADGGSGAFDFSFESIDGKPMPLAAFKGKALLVVNTASFCGYTRQYEGLQALYEQRERDGLVVVGVPSNDFGGQEPKSEGEIKEFCRGAFGVTFPLTAKTVVTGSRAHPFYAWASSAKGSAKPGWNFHKYVVGRDGQLVGSFPSQVPPDSSDLGTAIDRALAAPAP